ncbi:hypothetical protein Taro_028741 [Colocasia esculenta]|uniref:UV-B-induced protein n=1 Tax=Colocasia esculenta TaxID=4460 RepID=A0A843VP20_COLES|nr:hypothetical protein [Colocasia esculenta]
MSVGDPVTLLGRASRCRRCNSHCYKYVASRALTRSSALLARRAVSGGGGSFPNSDCRGFYFSVGFCAVYEAGSAPRGGGDGGSVGVGGGPGCSPRIGLSRPVQISRGGGEAWRLRGGEAGVHFLRFRGPVRRRTAQGDPKAIEMKDLDLRFPVSNQSSVSCINRSQRNTTPLLIIVAGDQWQHRRSISTPPKQGQRLRRSSCVVRASASAADPSPAQIAPLQLESPIGQFLSQILINHPHLLPAAVDQQLEQLQTDLDAEKQKEEPSTSGTDLVLYRRIAKVKANERKQALEEILYALIVQKFVDASVSLVPALSQSTDPSGKVDRWPPQEHMLEKLHSPEAYEMIQNHLAIILGNRTVDANTTAVISKLRVGQVYAASVMYGYFLKRVDQRFQLEKTMKALPWSSEGECSAVKQVMPDESRPLVQAWSLHPEVSSWSASPEFSSAGQTKSARMRSYVMSLDPETLHRYATVRSKEAFGIIEKHTEALFGRPEVVITPQGTIDSSKDEVIKISFSGLRRLILEAVTFGSFLWDVESYVDSRYHFVAN